MAENKKSFVLYADLIYTVEKLPDKKAGELFKHILKYVNDYKPETKDIIINIAFEPIKQQLKRDLIKWSNIKEVRSEAGKLGGRPKKQTKAKKTNALFEKQTKAKKAVNVNVNDNVNDSVNEIAKYFGFNELNNFDKISIISNFINLLVTNKNLDYFKTQFEFYKKYKKLADEKIHGFEKFIGYNSDNIDIKVGAWNAENWQDKFDKFKTKEPKKNTKFRNDDVEIYTDKIE